jgi:hypothetical protein
MAKHEVVAGLLIAAKHADEFHCVSCLEGKMTAPDLTPSGPKPRRAACDVSDSALRLAYMDIYGPLRVRGCDGSYFHMVLVLAESRKIYAYSLPDLKDGTIRKFLDLFLSRITKETDGLSLRALHTDNFSSFKSNVTHLASRGCHWEFITPGSSHQNPAERYIQRVNSTLRAVMLASGLPRFCGQFVLSACVFCCNLYPRKDELHSKEEMFSGCIPDVSPLRVIGCLALPHTADRFGSVDKSFTPRSTGEWLLAGYSGLSIDITGYILYDRVSGRTASFDLGAVKFSELVFPCHSASKHVDDLELDLDENSRDGLGRLRVASHHSPSHVAGGRSSSAALC